MNKNTVYGIVMCGGKSSRMRTDKSRIIYHEKEQQYHVYEILQAICNDVFISCNKEQQKFIDKKYNAIADENIYNAIGPLGGILSSFKKLIQGNLFVVGCDYPYLTKEVLKDFIDSVKASTIAAAFYNDKEELYEPLLAYYSHHCLPSLLEMFVENNYSLQYFLKKTCAEKYIMENYSIIKSIDRETEMKIVQDELNK